MKKRKWIAFLLALFATGLVAYRLCDAWTVIELAAKLHSEWGSVDCGHVTNSWYHGERIDPDTAIACAQNAFSQRRPFRIAFTNYGTDFAMSNAVVGNSKGDATELLLATGTVDVRNKLLRHPCDPPTRLIRDSNGYLPFHCAEWPPRNLKTDFLLW